MGCRWPAAATLSFRYASRQVWLLDLGEPDPALYDLCPHHADALIVPRGWHRADQRMATPVVREPSTHELAQRAAPRCEAGASRREPVSAAMPCREREPVPVAVAAGSAAPSRVNRYEGLVRDLPRLAAEFAGLRDGDIRGAAAGRQSPFRRQPVAGEGVIVPIQAARRHHFGSGRDT